MNDEICPNNLELLINTIRTQGNDHNKVFLNISNVKLLLELLEKLNVIITNNTSKDNIADHINRIVYFQNQSQIGFSGNNNKLHTIITGPCMKTKYKIINLLIQIWIILGKISQSSIHRVHADDLVGKYVGYTEFNIRQLLKNTSNSVIMITEIDNLINSNVFNDEFIMTINEHLVFGNNDPIIIIDIDYNKKIDFMRRFSLHIVHE